MIEIALFLNRVINLAITIQKISGTKLKDFNEDVFEETIARALKVERNTVDVVLKTVKMINIYMFLTIYFVHPLSK